MELLFAIVSVSLRLLATAWSVVVVWRTGDWKLGFLPLMLALTASQPLLPHFPTEHWSAFLVVILNAMAVLVFYILVRWSQFGSKNRVLGLMLVLVAGYQFASFFIGEAMPDVLGSELSVSFALCAGVILSGRVFEKHTQMSLSDPLTGVPNRIRFMQLLKAAHRRSRARKQYLFGVLFLDLDRFKILNDKFGHATGDQYLIHIAQRLKASLRPRDTVARLGGDEFAVLLDGLTEPAEAQRIVDRLRANLEEPATLQGHVIFTTASMGLALSTTQYKRPEDLLRDADTAMYRQKASQNGYDEIVSVQRQVRARSQLQLEGELQQALQDKQFVVHYQPIVALPSGEITGCEALVRWEHPTRGLLMPAEFIPVAESTGLILPIGEFVLRSACAQNQAWQQAGLPSLNMSVNVSARQLYRQQFADTVSEILAETGSPPGSIELELTESLLMEHPEKAAEMLAKLKDLGVRIAVDDFGTGYCSLSYLLRFPLHTLKIDKTFVDGLTGGDPRSYSIVEALIALARGLNLGVTAEGITSDDQLATLQSMQCNRGQGYLFSRPAPAEVLTTSLVKLSRLRRQHQTASRDLLIARTA